MKHNHTSKSFGDFKLIIFNDYSRQYIENEDAIINVRFNEEYIIPPHEIVSIQAQSIKSNNHDIEVININNNQDRYCSIIGDVNCGCSN